MARTTTTNARTARTAAAADVHTFVTVGDVAIPADAAVDAYAAATGADRAAIRRAATSAIADAVRAGAFDAATVWSGVITAMDAHRDVTAAPAVDYAAMVADRVIALTSAVYAIMCGDARPDGMPADIDGAAIRAAIASRIDVDIATVGASPSDAMTAIARYADGNGGASDDAIARYVTPRATRAGGRRDVTSAMVDAAAAGAFTVGTRYTWTGISRAVAGTRDDAYRPAPGAVGNRVRDADGTRADIATTAPGWSDVDASGATYRG